MSKQKKNVILNHFNLNTYIKENSVLHIVQEVHLSWYKETNQTVSESPEKRNRYQAGQVRKLNKSGEKTRMPKAGSNWFSFYHKGVSESTVIKRDV